MSLQELEAAASLVYRHLTPTAQIRWPLLERRAGCEVWVKHENHTPVGSFKVRGGLVGLDELRRRRPGLRGVAAATRGNHGQSLAFAARVHGLRATVVVPHGNSVEKNAAMRALGAEVIEHGRDFEEAVARCRRIVRERGLEMVESYDPVLARGVATAGLELLRAAPDLHTVYVPVGLGSGVCGMMLARDALRLRTEIVGVVAEEAPAYALSFERGEPVATESSATFADGIAVREPHPEALERIRAGVARIVRVTERGIADAVRHYYADTHNLAEGAGAAALAGLLRERDRMAGRKAGLVLTGGNIDRDLYLEILRGGVPRATAGAPAAPPGPSGTTGTCP